MAERRRQELEEKRQKLAEMRKMREQRQALLKTAESGATATPDAAPKATSQDIDALVSQLLGPSNNASAGPSRSRTPISALASHGNVLEGSSRPQTPISAGGSVRSGQRNALSEDGRAQTPVEAVGGEDEVMLDRPRSPLIDAERELFELPTKHAAVTYSRGVQTQPPLSRSPSIEDELEAEPQVGRETEEALRRRLEAEFERDKERLEREIRLEEEERLRLDRVVVDLSEEQRHQIFAAAEFSQFVEDSSKIIQRALSDAYDYTMDYRIAEQDVEGEDRNTVKLACAFSDERWTKSRSVMALDWSPKFPELLAAAYNKNPRAVNDPDGLVALWNLHLLDWPEFVFHAQSDVLSVAFSPFNPSLVFGGTYSGQILLWDTRAKQLPVLKSPLSTSGHTYPVYDMKVIGTQNAHNLITTSTDGLVCSWLTDMLAQPQESIELANKAHSRTNEVSITTFDFPDNEFSTFWIGTEEGGIHQAHRYDRAGAKAGLNVQQQYRGHAGPITSIDFHPLGGPVDFSDLFLSSSVDWTVKLWRTKGVNKVSALGTTTYEPLMTFEESDDHVYDARWHPQHPAMFGTVNGSGKFDLWNLNSDPESPMSSTTVGSGAALNKLAWDRKDGRHVALGGSDGVVSVYDLGTLAQPRDTEWSDLQQTIQTAIQQNAGPGGLR